MPETLSRVTEIMHRGITAIWPDAQPVITADTELSNILPEVERICALPFWLEEETGEIPTDAELLSWRTVGEVARWVDLVERRAA